MEQAVHLNHCKNISKTTTFRCISKIHIFHGISHEHICSVVDPKAAVDSLNSTEFLQDF